MECGLSRSCNIKNSMNITFMIVVTAWSILNHSGTIFDKYLEFSFVIIIFINANLFRINWT